MPKALDDIPWSGPERFVLGLDIGTAHSSVTFSHLRRGELPLNHRVTHWPAATGAGGSSDAKTASMLYYDRNNSLQAAGAAVTSLAMRHRAKVNDWNLVRYFKLELHPSTMIKQQDLEKFHFKALPSGLEVERVYADMIQYMIDHTRDFYEQRNGAGKWRQLSPFMTLVIAHPNGWGLKQQQQLRTAVVMAGIMTESEAKDRVKLVSEAEAAVHYILWEKSQELQPGSEIIVCDAGGSTADTTAYRVTIDESQEVIPEATSAANNRGPLPIQSPPPPKKKAFGGLFSRKSSKPPKPSKHAQPPGIEPQPEIKSKPAINLKEIKASDCQPAGGVFVNEALVAYLESRLYDLPPDQAENVKLCIQKAEESFEMNCKREFKDGRDAPAEYVVETGLGIPGYIDSTLLLDAKTVREFFEEPVRRIVTSIEKQMRGINPQYIFLVGGFGTSKYLRQRVEQTFGRRNIQVLFLDDAHGKAASDGSVIWYVRKGVTARAARMPFGVKIREAFNPNSAEHRARPQVIAASGDTRVSGKWSMIAETDQVFEERSASKRSYTKSYTTPNPDLEKFSTELYTWTNDAVSPPNWVIDPEGNIIDGFEWVCDIEANMNGMRGALTKRQGRRGDYWELGFDICIEFGGAELSAHLEWKEKGITKRGEATIVVT